MVKSGMKDIYILPVPSCFSQPGGKTLSLSTSVCPPLALGGRLFTGTAYRSLFSWPATWGTPLHSDLSQTLKKKKNNYSIWQSILLFIIIRRRRLDFESALLFLSLSNARQRGRQRKKPPLWKNLSQENYYKYYGEHPKHRIHFN